MTITPKRLYMMIVLLGAVLVIGDHLTSTALTDVGSPSDLGNACAPCGAPVPTPLLNSPLFYPVQWSLLYVANCLFGWWSGPGNK